MYMKYLIIALCGDVLSYPYYCIMQRCSIFLYGFLDESVETVTVYVYIYVL